MCPNCNSPVRSDQDFCTICGAALRGQPGGPAPAGGPTITGPAAGGPAAGGPAAGGPTAGGPPGPGQFRPAGSAPTYRFDIARLDTADRVIGGASIVVLISLFLPWFGVLGFTVSGIGLHGYLAISLIAAVAVIGYLVLRAGWETLPFRLPVAHAPLLLIGTGVQLLFVLIAFAFRPSGTSWEFGAYLGLLAALVACGVVAAPAISSMQAARQR